jgi:hypothetical protein
MPNKPLVSIKTSFLFSLVLPLLIGLYLVISSRQTDIDVNCDIQHATCTQYLAVGSVTLDILPKPVKAMEELTFQLTIEDYAFNDPPLIDLNMVEMDMGINQVRMKAIGEGIYRGKGIIVRCPTGKTAWRAWVFIPGLDKIEYIFNVIY